MELCMNAVRLQALHSSFFTSYIIILFFRCSYGDELAAKIFGCFKKDSKYPFENIIRVLTAE